MEALFERLTTNDAACVGPDTLNATVPRVGLLAGGGLRSIVTATGSGFVGLGDRILTRWRGDRVTDADGVFFYLRDLGSGAVWSAGYQPTRRVPERYEARFGPGIVEIEREDLGIVSRMSVCAVPDVPVELRCLVLTNQSERARRIEVTSYAELVLHHRDADAAHPAFSKLFVQTEKVDGEPVLLARRRPRSPEDLPIWAAHFSDAAEAWETDRLRFLGRGRTRRAPAALDAGAALSGTTGAVLDPIVSLRRTVWLEPGETAELVFGIAGGTTRDEVAALAARFTDSSVVRHAFAEASDRAAETREALAVSVEEAERFDAWAGALLYGRPADGERSRLDPDVPLGRLGELGLSVHDPLVAARIEDAAHLTYAADAAGGEGVLGRPRARRPARRTRW